MNTASSLTGDGSRKTLVFRLRFQLNTYMPTCALKITICIRKLYLAKVGWGSRTTEEINNASIMDKFFWSPKFVRQKMKAE